MEVGAELASIHDEDLLRQMWQQSEDFSRKKEIRTHLYKLREARLRDFYTPDNMDRTKDFGLGKSSLTPSHGESLADQSFQSFKTKEIRDSESPTRDMKFRNVGGGGGNNDGGFGVIVPDTSGWNIQKSSEVSSDGRAYRDETLATTEGVQKVKGGQAEFAGLNEEKSSGSYVGDENNYVQQAADSVRTKLHEKVVTGDPASGRTEMKTSSLVSSSSQKITSKKSTTGDMPAAFGDDYANSKLTNAIHEQQRQMQESRHQEQSRHESSFQQSRHESHHKSSNEYHTKQEQYQQQQETQQNKHVQHREEQHQTQSQLTKEQLTEMKQLQKSIHTYDKSSPEYQKYVDYLASQNGTVLSTTVERPKPNVKLITTKKQLDDGTIVTTRRYETEVDGSQTPSTVNYALNREENNMNRNVTHENRTQRLDEQDVFSRLSKTRDETRKFSKTFDDQSTQVTRDAQRRESVRSDKTDQMLNESIRQKTVKKDLSQTMKNERNSTSQFIDSERGTVPARPSPHDQPTSHNNRNVNLTEEQIRQENIRLTHDLSGHQPGYDKSSVHKEFTTDESQTSTKRTEHYEHHNERNETKKSSKDFTTHGFPSVRSDKPTSEDRNYRNGKSQRPSEDLGYPAARPTTQRPSEDHGFPAARPTTHRPSEDHGYPAARPTSQRPSEDHGYPAARSTTQRPSEDHGFPAARPTSQRPRADQGYPAVGPTSERPSEDHGYPAARPTSQHPSEDHGYPAAGLPSNRPTEDHGYPTARPTSQRPSDDHGYPAARSTSQQPSEDHGYPAAGLPSNRPTEDHGYPAARPTSQRPSEDHGYPAARPTSQQPREDHGYPAAGLPSHRPTEDHGYPAGRTSQRPSEDHGYPAARPYTQRPSEDHGYPAARPYTQRPSEDHYTPADRHQRPTEDHGYPVAKSQKPGEDHGYPATRSLNQHPKEDHGYPAARTSGSRTDQVKSVKSEHKDFRGSSESLRSEVRVDAAHNAFASSLRCASPSIDHSRPSSQRSMRTSVTSMRSTHSPQKHDTRSPSRESGTYAESTFSTRSKVADKRNSTTRSSVTSLKDRRNDMYVSNETIDLTTSHSDDRDRPNRGSQKLPTEKISSNYTSTRKESEIIDHSGENNKKRNIPATNTSEEPNNSEEKLLTKKIAYVDNKDFKDDGVIEEPIMKRNYYKVGRNENGVFNPTPETTSSIRDRRQKSPSPRHEPIGIEFIDNIPSRRSSKSPSPLKTIHTTASMATTNTNQTNKTTETQHKQNIQINIEDTTTTTKPYTIHGTIPKTEPKGYVPYDVGKKINDKQNRTTSKDVSYPAYLSSPKVASKTPVQPKSTSPDRANRIPTKVQAQKSTPKKTSLVSSPTLGPKQPNKVSGPSDRSKISKTTITTTTTRDVKNIANKFSKTVVDDNLPKVKTVKTTDHDDDDEGYEPDEINSNRKQLEPTSDDEGFEQESPREKSPARENNESPLSNGLRKIPTTDLDEDDILIEIKQVDSEFETDIIDSRRDSTIHNETIDITVDSKQQVREPFFLKESPSDEVKPKDSNNAPKPTLSRSETFEERCRHILGMEDTTIKTTTTTEDFLSTEKTNEEVNRLNLDRDYSVLQTQPLNVDELSTIQKTTSTIESTVDKASKKLPEKKKESSPVRKISTDSSNIQKHNIQEEVTWLKSVTQTDETTQELTDKHPKQSVPNKKRPDESIPVDRAQTNLKTYDKTSSVTKTRQTDRLTEQSPEGRPKEYTSEEPFDKSYPTTDETCEIVEQTIITKKTDKTDKNTIKSNEMRPKDSSSITRRPSDSKTSPVRRPSKNEKPLSPVNKRPKDLSPVGKRPLDSSPVGKRPLDSSPVGKRPLDSSPVGKRPLDSSPVGKRPLDSSPARRRPKDDLPTTKSRKDVSPSRPLNEYPIDDNEYIEITETTSIKKETLKNDVYNETTVDSSPNQNNVSPIEKLPLNVDIEPSNSSPTRKVESSQPKKRPNDASPKSKPYDSTPSKVNPQENFVVDTKTKRTTTSYREDKKYSSSTTPRNTPADSPESRSPETSPIRKPKITAARSPEQSPIRKPKSATAPRSPEQSPTRKPKSATAPRSPEQSPTRKTSTQSPIERPNHITTAKIQISPTAKSYTPEITISRSKPDDVKQSKNTPHDSTKTPQNNGPGPKSPTKTINKEKISSSRVITSSNQKSNKESVVSKVDIGKITDDVSDNEDILITTTTTTKTTKKQPVTTRKESAPVYGTTKVDREVQRMSRSTSDNIIKTTATKRQKQETENITQRKNSAGKVSPKTEKRPNKCLTTKTINLTTKDQIINSEEIEDVLIDIQQAKSSRESSPNKIVPTPVPLDLDTGKPRYPDAVHEPDDEPKKRPVVKNIPIFEEETNDFLRCQISEVNEFTEDTTKTKTKRFLDEESSFEKVNKPSERKYGSQENVEDEYNLSVHDKVSKFITTAEDESKPKTSSPFRRDVPQGELSEDDYLLTVDEKVNKFLKTAEQITTEVKTSSSKPIERPNLEDLDDEIKTDECVLSVSEKVNKFINKAEKLTPLAPQKSPELVAKIERQISRQSDDNRGDNDYVNTSTTTTEFTVVEKAPQEIIKEEETTSRFTKKTNLVNKTKSIFENGDKPKQKDILSRPSVWENKRSHEVKLEDIGVFKMTDSDEEITETNRSSRSRSRELDETDYKAPVNSTNSRKFSHILTDTVNSKKDLFENRISNLKTENIKTNVKVQKKATTPVKKPEKSPTRPKETSTITRGPKEQGRVPYHSSPNKVNLQPMQPQNSSPTRNTTRSTVEESYTTITTSTTGRRRLSDNLPGNKPLNDLPTRTSVSENDDYLATDEIRRRPDERRQTTPQSPVDLSASRITSKTTITEDETSSRTKSVSRSPTRVSESPSLRGRPISRSPEEPSAPRLEDISPTRSTSSYSQDYTSYKTTLSSKKSERPESIPHPRRGQETVAAKRNMFESGNISPTTATTTRPSYMEHTRSSIEHSRRDSLEVNKSNYHRKPSATDEPFETNPTSSVKFGVDLKHKPDDQPRRKSSCPEIPHIEDIFDLELLEQMLNTVVAYEQRRRIRAQIRVVKKIIETKKNKESATVTKTTTTVTKNNSPNGTSSVDNARTKTTLQKEKNRLDSSRSFIESETHHVSRHEKKTIRERSVSPTKTKTVTTITEVRKVLDKPKLINVIPKDEKPIWATKNILKKASENERSNKMTTAKKTTTSTSRTQVPRQKMPLDEDCVTSSYGIGPTDEDGRPLFGIRALKKKPQSSETTKITGSVITEKFYSENGSEPVGERKVTVYSTNPEELEELETEYDRRDIDTIKREKLSSDGLTSITKVQKIGKYDETPAIRESIRTNTSKTSKLGRRGSVKEMSEKFIRKESSSSITEKKTSSGSYPKAGLILRTRTHGSRDVTPELSDDHDHFEIRAGSVDCENESEDDCDFEYRTSKKSSRVVTESESETESVTIRRRTNKSTKSFLNSSGAKVTGVTDVLDRMRNADNVMEDGDTIEDQEARALLNKFLGASVLMSGVESMVPKEARKSNGTDDNLSQHEVKTTRVTKTYKTESSSSPVARKTLDIEEIWDEETLRQLLEESTSYEERREIRARLKQLMAEREVCAEIIASVTAELEQDKEKKQEINNSKTTQKQSVKIVKEEEKVVVANKKVFEKVASTETNDEEDIEEEEEYSSEYEEIIEEVTDDDDEVDEIEVDNVKDAKQKQILVDENKSLTTKTIVKENNVQPIASVKKIESVVTDTTEEFETDSSDDDDDQDETDNNDKEEVLNKKEQITGTVEEKPDKIETIEKDSKTVKDELPNKDANFNSVEQGESLIPLLQGLLHKNMPPVRNSKTANQNSINCKTIDYNNCKNNGNSGSSKSSNIECKNNNLGSKLIKSNSTTVNTKVGSNNNNVNNNNCNLKVANEQGANGIHIEDSGTESGEDLRLIAAGLRNSIEMHSGKDQGEADLISDVTLALTRLESSLKEGRDIPLDSAKRNALLTLVGRLQTGLISPEKISEPTPAQGLDDETSSPEADNHRSNRQRFAKRRNRANRHTVGVSREELADARRYMEDLVMMETLSSCTTPESTAVTPPEFFAIQKQNSAGAILGNDIQEPSTLFRPNQFVPDNLKHSTESNGGIAPNQYSQPVQMREKKPQYMSQQRQSADSTNLTVPVVNPKRPLSDSYANNKVIFQIGESDGENNCYLSDDPQSNQMRTLEYNSDQNPNCISPDLTRAARFSNKKQMMKRANTIDIPKPIKYMNEMDSDSEIEDRGLSSAKALGLRGTVQVSVKRKPRQVVPEFEPKTENDRKFLAFIRKQNPTPGLGWNNPSKSVSNWTNKFGNIKNSFEHGAVATSSKPPVPSSTSSGTAKNFWKRTENNNQAANAISKSMPPSPKTMDRSIKPPWSDKNYSSDVLTSALRSKKLNEMTNEVIVPKPVSVNQFFHAPQSAFQPVEIPPQIHQSQFKPIKSDPRIQLQKKATTSSPLYSQPSPTKSWPIIDKSSNPNSPIGLPWKSKPKTENSVLKMAASRFENKSPNTNNVSLNRNGSFQNQDRAYQQRMVSYDDNRVNQKRPSLPNAADPYNQNQYCNQKYINKAHNQQPQYKSHHNLGYYQENSNPQYHQEYSPIVPYSANEYSLAGAYPQIPPFNLSRQDSLTNPSAEPLILTSSMPAYSPHALRNNEEMMKIYDFISPTDSITTSPMLTQTEVTDDDLDQECMTEYRVQTKVMQGPVSQQAETVKQRTNRVNDNEESYGKHTKAAKSLLSVMKNIGSNRSSEKSGSQRSTLSKSPNVCLSPDGRSYQAPLVQPLFPDVTKFEANRQPLYIESENPIPPARYAHNPAYVPPKSHNNHQPNKKVHETKNNAYGYDGYGHNPQKFDGYGQPIPFEYNHHQQRQHHNPTQTTYPQNVYAHQRDIIDHGMIDHYSERPEKLVLNRAPIYPDEDRPLYPAQFGQYSQQPNQYHIQQQYSEPYQYPLPPVQQQQPQHLYQDQRRAGPPQNVYVPQNKNEYIQPPQQTAPVPVRNMDYQQNNSKYEVLSHPYGGPIQVEKNRKQAQEQNHSLQEQHGYKYQDMKHETTQSYRPPAEEVNKIQPEPIHDHHLENVAPPPVVSDFENSKNSKSIHVDSKPRSEPTRTAPPVPKQNSEKIVRRNSVDYTASVSSSQSYKLIEAVHPHPVYQERYKPSTKPKDSNNNNKTVQMLRQASLDGQKRIMSQAMRYENGEESHTEQLKSSVQAIKNERAEEIKQIQSHAQSAFKEIRRKSIGNELNSSAQIKSETITKKVKVVAQETSETKTIYKSSAPADTPDIVKSSLPKDENFPILKKFGPPQRHCYVPNSYQNPLSKSETMSSTKFIAANQVNISRKMSEPSVVTKFNTPYVVETPATPEPSKDEIPRNIVLNNIAQFSGMSQQRYVETSSSHYQQSQSNSSMTKGHCWNQICQKQNAPKPPSPRFNLSTESALRRSKSGHTLAVPKLYEAGINKADLSEKQRTVEAYFSGQKSPNALSRNSSQTKLQDDNEIITVKKSSINRIRTSEKASIRNQKTNVGLARSQTMPHIANLNLLDETNVEDAFEQLMNAKSTTTQKTETKEEDGAVVTTTTKVTTRTVSSAPKPVSPFAKFKQLDKQNSLQSPRSPLTPTTPGGTSNAPMFKFTDPALNARALTVKDQLLQWCQSKTKEYENVQITNFSACWTDGLAFCALIHHFLPDSFDYSKLTPQHRRHNFELAFRVADEKAGIAPLLDVEDMVVMKRPDWKCVFTYVQSIYRRFRNCQ